MQVELAGTRWERCTYCEFVGTCDEYYLFITSKGKRIHLATTYLHRPSLFCSRMFNQSLRTFIVRWAPDQNQGWCKIPRPASTDDSDDDEVKFSLSLSLSLSLFLSPLSLTGSPSFLSSPCSALLSSPFLTPPLLTHLPSFPPRCLF